MKRKKLYKRQSEGLFLIRDGLVTQIGMLKNFKDVTEKDSVRMHELDSGIRVMEYWLDQVEKAYSGELCLKKLRGKCNEEKQSE